MNNVERQVNRTIQQIESLGLAINRIGMKVEPEGKEGET